MLHRLSTTDPISGRDIADTAGKPYIVEGTAHNDLTIYFESEANRQAYLEIPIERPISELSVNLDNPTDIFIDQG